MDKEKEVLNLENYILIPTKKFRARRVPFGRYVLEKELAVYNLWGPGHQSSRPFLHVWCDLRDEDISFLEIDKYTRFQMI